MTRSRRATPILCVGALLNLAQPACSSGKSGGAAHLQQGDAFLAESKLHKAIDEYELALKTSAHDDALIKLLGAYESAGEYAKAEKILAEAISKRPTDPALRITKARILAETGRVRLAFDEMRRLSAVAPGNADALALGAVFATTREEARLAVDKLTSWHELQARRAGGKEAAETYLPLAWLHEKLGEPEAAKQARARAVALGVKELGLALSVGNGYFSQERLLPAEEMFELAAQKAPKRSATWLRLATVRVGLREWVGADEALKHLDAAQRAEPETQLIEARIRLGLGRQPEAEKLLTALLSGPHDADNLPVLSDARLWLGHTRWAQGDAAGAEREYREALALDPGFEAAELGLAELHLSESEPARAIDELTKLTAKRPDSSEAFRLLGQAQLAAGDHARALDAFQRYIELEPEASQGPYLVGTALVVQGDLAEARKRFETALALDPSALPPLSALVSLMVRQKQTVEAENRIQIELARRGRSAELLGLLGDVLYEQRKDDPAKLAEAERAYREAGAADASYTPAFLALGQLYSATERNGAALLAYQAGLSRARDPSPLWLGIGELHARQGDATEAKQAYEQILARNPDSLPALNSLALVEAEQLNDLEGARKLAEHARQLAPDAANLADTYGWILLQLGDLERALPILQDAASRLPRSAEAQSHFGFALLKTGRKDEARAALTRALDLSSTFAGARDARLGLSGK